MVDYAVAGRLTGDIPQLSRSSSGRAVPDADRGLMRPARRLRGRRGAERRCTTASASGPWAAYRASALAPSRSRSGSAKRGALRLHAPRDADDVVVAPRRDARRRSISASLPPVRRAVPARAFRAPWRRRRHQKSSFIATEAQPRLEKMETHPEAATKRRRAARGQRCSALVTLADPPVPSPRNNRRHGPQTAMRTPLIVMIGQPAGLIGFGSFGS